MVDIPTVHLVAADSAKLLPKRPEQIDRYDRPDRRIVRAVRPVIPINTYGEPPCT